MARTLSVIVPVFNEEQTLHYTHGELSKLAEDPRLKSSLVELVYVNDGSSDASATILRELAQSERPSVRIIEFSRNFGHSSAVLAGLEAATGDVLAVVDADLQDPPSLIPEMVERLDAAPCDVVYGQRARREGETAFKRLTAWGFYRFLRFVTRIDIPPDTGDFRVLTREVRDAVVSCQEREPFLRGLVAWVGFRQVAFPYERVGRKYGETKYPLRKMLRFAFQAVLSFSSAPLLVSLWTGAAGLAVCAGISAWATVQHLRGETVSGWTSLLIGFMLGQSVTILMVGIVGAYLGRIFSELQGRPRYIVRRERGADSAPPLRRSA